MNTNDKAFEALVDELRTVPGRAAELVLKTTDPTELATLREAIGKARDLGGRW